MPATVISRLALVVAPIGILGLGGLAHAGKRRSNGCDRIGGDFAEPGEVIFNTGCRGAGTGRHAAGTAVPRDKPPKLLDRVSARAPLNYGATTRQAIGNGIERFQVVGGKIIYGLDGGGRLWGMTLGGKDAAVVAQSVNRFRATEAGLLFVLEKDGTLWCMQGDGSKRAFVDHQVGDCQPTQDHVYVLATDKRLWRLGVDGQGRELVDETVNAFQATASTLIFVLGTDGVLWRETGDFRSRVKVAQPVTELEYVADGDTAYVLTPAHILWRQKGTNAPEQVDHDVAAFHAVDMDLAYVLATDGRLWQELGERSQAVLVDGDLAIKSGADAFQFSSTGGIEGQLVYLLDRKHTLWAETMPSTRDGPKGRTH